MSEKEYTRKDDSMIEEIQKDVKEIKKLLLGNGKIGLCEQVRINDTRLKNFENKSDKIRNILVALSVIISTVFAGISIFKG